MLGLIVMTSVGRATADARPWSGAAAGANAAATLQQALTRCQPGAPFGACTESLRAASCDVELRQGSAHYGVQIARVRLGAPPYRLEVATQRDAGDRILRVSFFLSGNDPSARRPLLKWLKEQVRGARLGDAYGAGAAIGCGPSGSGVAWFDGDAAQPQVQYSVGTRPSIGGARDPANVEQLMHKAHTDEIILCFLLPQNSDGHGYLADPRYAAVLAELVHAPLLSTLTCQARH